MKKLISSCFIVHNMDDYLYESISSVIGFSDEIVVVDNCSTDNSLEIIRSFGDKITLVSKKFEGKTYQDIVKQKRNLCLSMAKGDWILFIDPDEIYMQKDLKWLHKTIRTTNKVHIRYSSVQFWKTFDSVISGPHWDDTQERCFKNLPGLKYDKFAFSVSVNGEILAKKYGKKYEDGIYWATENQIKIFHYGMCIHPDKIRRKLTNYMLSDNPAVTPDNVESFVNRHPYFSGDFNQPRHGPKGLWVAGSDSEKTREKVLGFKENHPESMKAKVSQFHKIGKMSWEVI